MEVLQLQFMNLVKLDYKAWSGIFHCMNNIYNVQLFYSLVDDL